jgi:uncharacterized glyoxalase superfamily protein PhnB
MPKVAGKQSKTSKKSVRMTAKPAARSAKAATTKPARKKAAPKMENPPVTLYMVVDNVDEIFGNAVAAGGRVLMPVADMFWGDRCGIIADPEGNKWMLATHVSEPSEAEMAAAMQASQE